MSDELDKDKQVITPAHDKFFKKIFPNLVATEEDIKNFMPAELVDRIDTGSFKIEQESYIEENLKQYFSDVVCSFKTKDKTDEVFLYFLTEHASTVDYWIALRLLRYSLLLCEKHKKGKNKLPIVVQAVVYNGITKYTAPRNLWDLFKEPELAKTIFCEDYKLIDLYATSDEEITNKFSKKLSTAGHLFLMKHIRDITTELELLKQYISFFDLTKESDRIELVKGLWYIHTSASKEAIAQIRAKIIEYIPQGEELMKSAAQSLEEEGIAKGRVEGIAKGKKVGFVQTKQAILMLKQGKNIADIVKATGLSKSEVIELSNLYK